MRGRPLGLLCLLCACFLLSGCQSRTAAANPRATLPPVVSRLTAPENDLNQTYEQTVLLYLPARDGSQLLAVPQTATLSASRIILQTQLCKVK